MQASKHNLHALYGTLYTCQSILSDSNSTSGTLGNKNLLEGKTSTLSTTTSNNNTIIDHELKVTQQLLIWVKNELDLLLIGHKSNNHPMKLVYDSII